MSDIKYCVVSHEDYPSFEVLFNEPLRIIKYITTERKKESQYLQCPAVQEIFKNTFVIQSPIDIAFMYIKNTNTIKITGGPLVDNNFYNKFVDFRRNQLGKNDPPLVTCGIINLLFYTKESTYIEVIPASIATHNISNYNIIPGRFKIDKWIRPIDFTFEFIDENKPIIIKRGDPLFCIRFHTENNSRVELTREIYDSMLHKANISTTIVKFFQQNVPLEKLYKMAEPFMKQFWKNRDKK